MRVLASYLKSISKGLVKLKVYIVYLRFVLEGCVPLNGDGYHRVN